MIRRFVALALATLTALGLLAAPALAVAVVPYFQYFEVDASTWSDGGSFGDIEQVPSGTNGIVSSAGAGHAEVTEGGGSGPYSFFGGAADEFPGTFSAELDVYLDPSWADGSGFDYSVAANGSDGNHQRDYIFHVAKDTSSGDLLVAASNNTNFAVREDLDTLTNNFTVTDAGWYTLRHTFYDDGTANPGFLAVDLQLVDSDGTVLWVETRGVGNGGVDPIADVGGNRYAWFTTIDQISLAIDNHELCLGEACAAALPQDKEDCRKGGWAEFGIFKNQGDCVAFVATGGRNQAQG